MQVGLPSCPTLRPGWMPAKFVQQEGDPKCSLALLPAKHILPLLRPLPSHQGEGGVPWTAEGAERPHSQTPLGRDPQAAGVPAAPAFPWVLRSDCQPAPYLCISLTLSSDQLPVVPMVSCQEMKLEKAYLQAPGGL